MEALAQGRAHAVPLIVGSNADEGRLFARFEGYLPTSEPVIERLLADAEPVVGSQIRAAYPAYPRREACLQIGGDYAFTSMAWQIAEAHAGHAPTFMYRYDYAPRVLSWAGLGATHATELLAVFDLYHNRFGALLTIAGDRGSARRVSRSVQRHWRSFVATGVPGTEWPRYRDPARPVMVFDRRARVEYDPMSVRRKAWQHHGHGP